MDNLPNLAIALVTYARTDLALRTIRSVSENLRWPKDKRAWSISDDGSPHEHVDAIRQTLYECGETITYMNVHRFGGGTYFCGHGWNLALGNAYQYSDYVLWLEDDWELEHPLEIKDYIQLLSERSDVGMIRLGVLAVGNTVELVGHNGVHYLKYLKNKPYAYSGNPSLRHARFVNAYGFFAEDRNPGDIELEFDFRFQNQDGPDIWRPAGINEWGAFGHIGREKSYE